MGVSTLALLPFLLLAQDPIELKVKLTEEPEAGKTKLKAEGTAVLPEMAVLGGTLTPLVEKWEAGKLVPDAGRTVEVRSRGLIVKERKFRVESAADRPGTWRLDLSLDDAIQSNRGVVAAIKDLKPRQWTFRLDAWSRPWVDGLGDRLVEMDGIIDETLQHLAKVNAAVAGPQAWEDAGPRVREANDLLIGRIGQSPAGAAFTAAAGLINRELLELRTDLASLIFANGKPYRPAGSGGAQEPKLIDPAKLRKIVAEGPAIAGRELALWAVKDIRKAGERRPALMEVVKKHKDHPGLSPFAGRVQTDADLDSLEKAIRQ
jgi:hypothetical protein